MDVTTGEATFGVIQHTSCETTESCIPTVADTVKVAVEVVVLVLLTVLVGVGMWRQSQALEIIEVAKAVT